MTIQPPINVAALTCHDCTPSSRFRIRQFIERLKKDYIFIDDLSRKFSSELAGLSFPEERIRSSYRKLELALYYEARNFMDSYSRAISSRNYDVTWISRELIIGYPSLEFVLSNPVIYDIDDAIFLRNKYLRSGIDFLIRNSSIVFAANKYLGDYCNQFSNNVIIIPTSVDTNRFRPSKQSFDHNSKFVIGWSGTSSSGSYLMSIEDSLLKFFTHHRNCVLRICSDREPSYLTKIKEYIEYEPWTPQEEQTQIQSFDVGIMPLIESEWIKGKSAYKMLLYMSCGVPVIASNIGLNKDLFQLGSIGLPCDSQEEWYDALNEMYLNRDSIHKQFSSGRDIVLQNYSLDSVYNKISHAFLNLKSYI